MKQEKVIVFSNEKYLIGQRLIQILGDRDIKHLQLSCSSGVNEGVLSKMCHGTQNFCIETLLCILAELKMSMYDFFDCDSLRHIVVRVKSEWKPEKA